MDFDYVAAPAILLLTGIPLVWLAIRHIRSLPTRFAQRWLRVVDRVILSVLLVVWAAVTSSASLNAIALLRFRLLTVPPEEMYLVNGHRMHMHCTGSGSPAIVLDSGLGSDALIWGRVQPELERTTRVCSYDRAGFGWSEPVAGPRDADHIAAELHDLLIQAKVHGRVVLMGHSIAGIYIRDYAARYRKQVAGLIFVDGSTPLQDENPALRATGETGLSRRASMLVMRALAVVGISRLSGSCAGPLPGFDPHAGQLLAEDLCHPQFQAIKAELDSFNASGHETVHTGPFGALPVLIFSQDPAKAVGQPHAPRQMVAMEKAWNQMQENLKRLSRRSRRIIARGSSHAVQIDRADLLGQEVPRFIEQIRGTAPQPTHYGSTVME